MATKINNTQLPDVIKNKTIDTSNDIDTTTTKLTITGGTNGQVLSTDGSGNLSWTTASGGGGITDGDKGDITVSGSGATWTIDNDAVTYAKIQNVTTSRLLGRATAGSGDVEEITLGTNLSFSGTTLNAASGGGISDGDKGDITVSASGATWTIDNDAVTYAKIQNVTTNRLLGRVSSGSGDTEEITIGSGLSVSGTTLSALGAPTAVVTKTSDESVTSSTTVQDDDQLSYAMTANKTYWFELKIIAGRLNSVSNNRLRVGIGAGSSGHFMIDNSSTPTICDGTTSLTTPNLTGTTNLRVPHVLSGSVRPSSDTTLQFKWAQVLSDTNTVTVYSGSRLLVWEVA